MQEFKDSKDQAWPLAMTIGAVKRVKRLCGVDLFDPLGTGRKKQSGKARRVKPRRPLVTRLQLDPGLLVDVIFALVKPTADERGISDEQFAELLGPERAYDAFQAFMVEWRDFFLKLRRETEAKAIGANMELVAAEDKRNVTLVEKATEAATAVAETNRQKAIEKIKSLGKNGTATDSPESSGSIPGPLTG